MQSEIEIREIIAEPGEIVLKVAALSSDMGFLGFEPYDQRATYNRTKTNYQITIYFRKRKDGREGEERMSKLEIALQVIARVSTTNISELAIIFNVPRPERKEDWSMNELMSAWHFDITRAACSFVADALTK